MKLKVLIVDDDSRFRELISDFLKNEGLEVIEACNGQEALNIFFREKEIKLIILDIMMPIFDGWEVLAEIRKHSSVPVIMLTALGDEINEASLFDLIYQWDSCFGSVVIYNKKSSGEMSIE